MTAPDPAAGPLPARDVDACCRLIAARRDVEQAFASSLPRARADAFSHLKVANFGAVEVGIEIASDLVSVGNRCLTGRGTGVDDVATFDSAGVSGAKD